MTESKEVVFVHASPSNLRYEPWEPLNLGILQAILEEKGISTYLIDAYRDNLSSEKVIKEIKKKNPAIVGISAVDLSLPQALNISKKLKEEDYIVCLGGYGPTFQYERCLNEGKCDFVVRGEGEYPVSQLFPELLNNNKGHIKRTKGICYKDGDEIIKTSNQKIVYDLDRLPFPLRRDMPPEKYKKDNILGATFISARGCYWGKCKFCDIRKFPGGKKYRRRSPQNIIEELKMLHDDYGISLVADMSSCFLGINEDWVKKFFNLLKDNFDDIYLKFETRADTFLKFKNILEDNLDIIFGIDVGIENFDDNWLKRNYKGTNRVQNIKTIETLKEFKNIRDHMDTDRYCTFFNYFTIDVDGDTTLEEFTRHYNTLKELEIVGTWRPNIMLYYPWISKEQQDEIWKEKSNPDALALKYAIENLYGCGGYLSNSRALNENRLNDRRDMLSSFFDELLKEMKKIKYS